MPPPHIPSELSLSYGACQAMLPPRVPSKIHRPTCGCRDLAMPLSRLPLHAPPTQPRLQRPLIACPCLPRLCLRTPLTAPLPRCAVQALPPHPPRPRRRKRHMCVASLIPDHVCRPPHHHPRGVRDAARSGHEQASVGPRMRVRKQAAVPKLVEAVGGSKVAVAGALKWQ